MAFGDVVKLDKLPLKVRPNVALLIFSGIKVVAH